MGDMGPVYRTSLSTGLSEAGPMPHRLVSYTTRQKMVRPKLRTTTLPFLTSSSPTRTRPGSVGLDFHRCEKAVTPKGAKGIDVSVCECNQLCVQVPLSHILVLT